MMEEKLRQLLSDVASGQVSVGEGMNQLKGLPFEELGFARVDVHRGLRRGFPEVVFGEGKTPEQILPIAECILRHHQPLLVTRLSADKAVPLSARFPEGCYDPLSRTFTLAREPIEDRGRGIVLVIAAGTSDLSVAEEAAVTARMMGNRVERLLDVGVAGIHRLLSDRDKLVQAEVLIVVAGMEGALPSVVGGLVDRPLIAVPTSVGYGASFGGLAALLAMLNSCASGVTVVNIDNGFGAGVAASLINRRREDGS